MDKGVRIRMPLMHKVIKTTFSIRCRRFFCWKSKFLKQEVKT